MISVTALALLTWAGWRTARAGQGAVSWSRAGQEDLTFWVNHNGLADIDVEGEVGFGDMARILMRRRANSANMKALRDRFVFRVREFDKLTTPDLVASRFVVAQNRVFNLPVVRDGKGYFYKVVERETGVVHRSVGGREIELDVRPLVRLKVHLSEPARVYITGADGLGYAPTGTISRFTSESSEQYFHASGTFELDLPAGETLIEAARGPEYELAHQTIDLRRPAQVRLDLKRWIDMKARGWYSSDAHIHANYTADHHQVVTPEDVLAYTLGEDLHIPNMMVANSSGAFLHDTKFFEGKLHALSRAPYLIWWNEEMRNAGLYGHMCLYGLKTLVEPLYTGFRDTPQSDDYPPNFAQAKAARAQGGAVTYAHPGYSTAIDGFSARELPVDAALGEIDAMDVMSNNPEEIAMENWYRLLNCGLRIGISAGTDSFTNVADHYTPGGHRVYAHLQGPLRYQDWIAAYKGGRTFATNGPMVFLTVNGKEPGDEIKLPGPGEVTVRVEARWGGLQPAADFSPPKVELIVNGKSQPIPPSARVRIAESSWIAARVTGPWNRLVLNDAYTFAHTSPVWVTVGGKPVWSEADARFWMEWIDKLIERVQQRGRFATAARRQEVVDLFRRGREFYARGPAVR